MEGIGHNSPDIDWGYHAREKVIDSNWISPEGIKNTCLQERDITLYLVMTHKLRYGVENVQMSAGLAAKLMRESKATAHRRLMRLTKCGLLKRVSMGSGKRGSIFSGNYSQDELEEIITSTLKAMRETLKHPLASHPSVNRETSSVSSMGETLNGNHPNTKSFGNLASHESGLASHEDPLASHSMGETTKANAKEYTNGSTNGVSNSPIKSSKDWADEDIWFDETVGALRITPTYRELVRVEGFSDEHITRALNTASKNFKENMTPPQRKSLLLAYCQYAKNDAAKFNPQPKKGFQP